ncbi:MAG: NAD(P)/FAD-dependent oxidoreductase [Bacteroidales bacterium]
MRKTIQLTLKPEAYFDKDALEKLIAQESGIERKYLSYMLSKESLDARKTPVYHLDIIVSSNNDLPKIIPEPFLNVSNSMQIIVVGAGPCGLIAALKLIQKGLKPIIVERGSQVEVRKQDTANIVRNGSINEESNFCFGEGGAGTFSDGKLFTRSNKKGNVEEVLRLLVHFGAKKEILFQTHPHIGTDVLSRIIKNIREQILKSGGEYRFNTKVANFIVKDGEVLGVTTSDGEDIIASKVILATGHSAKDIYQLFYDNKWMIEPKPFAIGVRVEHPQELINEIQYHNTNYSPLLPPAEYSLTAQNNDRGVFSFCMCPGGVVVPTVDKENIMVVNGMSNSSRSGKFANSAIVVTVNERDAREFKEFGALSLLKLQQKWEHIMHFNKCICPAQRLDDFVAGRQSATLAESSYKPGLVNMKMEDRLPKFVSDSLRVGFQIFNRKMRGFISNQANIIGLESRTSAPVRIVRDKNSMQHPQLKNLYPCGEGAGYAGGITSSAIDGINVAKRIAEELGV